MKNVLSIEQSARLIELGVDCNKASSFFYTTDPCNPKKRIRKYQFRLNDLLRILPKKITDRRNIYELRIGITDCLSGDEHWYVVYKDSRTDIDELESFQSAEELCDAIYDMICWIKTNKIKEL